MQKISLLEIYLIFLKIGIQLLGGGYVILPLLNKYLVKEKQILTEEEVIDYFALSQCVPGIIAGNISMFTGYKVRKTLGALAAIAGVVTTPFIAIVVLAHLLTNLVSNEIVESAFYGIKIAVIILVLLTLKEMWAKSVNSKFTYILFIILFTLMLLLKLSPAVAVVSSALIAFIYFKIKEKINA